MRRRTEISGGDLAAANVMAEHIFNTGAVGAGRAAENPIEADCAGAVGGAARCGERIIRMVFITRRDRLHRRVDQRDLRRKQIAEQSRYPPGDVDPGTSDRCDRQNFDASHASGRAFPDRAAAKKRKPLRYFFAAGAQRGASP